MERLNLLSRVLAFLAALLTVAVSLLGVGPASAVAPHSTYDDAATAGATMTGTLRAPERSADVAVNWGNVVG